MKIFGRSPRRIAASLRHFPRVLATLSAARMFGAPLGVAWMYLRRRCPAMVTWKHGRGYTVHLTGDEDDLVTVLVVLGRGDYGEIPPEAVVIDVGAHLGSFTIYAMGNGAKRVYAYEPNPELYQALEANVVDNGWSAQVQACEAAVVGSGAGRITFYPEANASSRVTPYEGETGGITVTAVTLSDIVLRNDIPHVDLLKLDCEGSEYGIISDTPDEIWERVARVRLEYHHGKTHEILGRFEQLGFRRTRFLQNDASAGLMWFER